MFQDSINIRIHLDELVALHINLSGKLCELVALCGELVALLSNLSGKLFEAAIHVSLYVCQIRIYQAVATLN